MKKYTIKENRPELSKAEVENGMDFEKIKTAAKPAKVISLGKYLAVGIAASIVAAAIIFWQEKPGKGTMLATNSERIILPNVENNPDTFVVNTSQDTMLVYNTGSKIKIPAGAFVNEKGQPVTGKVKINYREFHKVSEILLAGIPMRYDSAGKEMYFESAGMFDISAKEGEKPVFIAPDKSLQVSLATLDDRDKKFNQYLLNEKTGEWKFLKRDEVEVIKSTDTVAAVTSKADSVRKTAPARPMNERMFTIDATGREELQVYKDIVFEVTPDCKTFNPEEAKTDWGMVNVEKLPKDDKYKVTFSYPLSGSLRTYEVIARPLKDANMEAMMKKYGDLYAAYKKELSAAQKSDIAAEEALQKERAVYQNVFEKYQELQERNAQLFAVRYAKVDQVSQVVYRTFQIKEFGIWNSDCPSSMPQGVEVFAKFETTNGEPLKIAAVYLVEKGRNAMFNLYVPEKFSFNPDAENILLVVTNDGKLGWVKNDVFNLIDKSTKNFIFKLNVMDKDKYKLSDIDGLVS